MAATRVSVSSGRHLPGLAERRDPGPPQGLADVDVAEARDDALVEEDRLHRREAAGHAGGEGGGGEGVAEGLGAEAGEQRVGVEHGRRHEVDQAEAAGVVEGEAGAVVEVEDDVVVLFGRRVRVVEDADRGAGDEDAAGHAEVDDQRLAAVEVGEEILGAAAQRGDPGAGEAGGEPRRERAAEVGAADVGVDDDAAGQDGLEAAADGLDLGKLGHGGNLHGSGAVAAGRACLIRRRGSDRKAEAHDRRTHDPLRLRDRAGGREGRAGARRLLVGRLALRPDERRDEPRRPPAVEGRDARLAGAAAGDAAARRRRRDRGHRLPLPRPGEGRRARDGARHDRGHADRGAAAGGGDDASPTGSSGWWATRWRCPSPTRASTPTRSRSGSGT